MPLVLPGQEVRWNEPGRTFERHHHLGAYAALLVSGSCHETGDRGRHRAVAGDVLVHRSFDGHGDRVGPSGAAFINIPLDRPLNCAFGRVADLDAVVRAFERSALHGRDEFYAQFEECGRRADDWPDMLAAELSGRPAGSLAGWAEAQGLHPTSVSRGFRLAYGVSPKRFRLEQMAARAARRIQRSGDSLSAVAADVGFADQAHMSRTLSQLFAITPRDLRKLS